MVCCANKNAQGTPIYIILYRILRNSLNVLETCKNTCFQSFPLNFDADENFTITDWKSMNRLRALNKSNKYVSEIQNKMKFLIHSLRRTQSESVTAES